MRTPRTRWLAGLLGLALAALSCDGGPPRPRLVLLHVSSSVNTTHLAPYRAEVPYTPRLAEFASRGVVFERHQTDTGASGPATATLFTGSDAERHRVFRPMDALGSEGTTIFEAFLAAGYEPFFFTGHPEANAALGFGRGVPKGNVHPRRLRARDPAFVAVLERLKSDPDYRALVVTNLDFVDLPYDPTRLAGLIKQHPELVDGISTFRRLRFAQIHTVRQPALAWNTGEALRELGLQPIDWADLVRIIGLHYAGVVARMDLVFGEAVRAVDDHGLFDQSLVAFTADHGELLYRESAPFQWGHEMQLGPEIVSTPLIVSAPGLAPGRYPALSRSVDVLPTLAGLAGVALPDDQVTGRDLSAALRGAESPPELTAFFHTSLPPPSFYRRLEKGAPDFALAARLFPTPDLALAWVGARRGDVQLNHRRSEVGDWVWERFELAPGEPVPAPTTAPDTAPPDPELAEEIAARKERLLAAFAERDGP